MIGQGMEPQQALKKVGAVVEGYYAAATGKELEMCIRDRIWMLEEGRIVDFKGGYEAWLAKKAREEELKNVLKPQSKKKTEKEKTKEKKKQPGGTKMTEKKRNATEREIAKVEEQLQELAESMENCGSDYQMCIRDSRGGYVGCFVQPGPHLN